MAGDWIKVEHATADKPEVLRAAEMLGINRDEMLGILFRYWIWLDRNLSGSCPDVVRNVSKKGLDEFMRCAGFAAVLDAIGWAEFDENAWTIRIINAQRHNGNTAKSRALDNKRKSGKRLENVRQMSGSEPDKDRTREEKRRVVKPSNPRGPNGHADYPLDFERFWMAYPKKVAKGAALKAWGHAHADIALLLASLSWQTKSVEWTREGGQYAPNPATYLNQRRWEDSPAAPAFVSAKRTVV